MAANDTELLQQLLQAVGIQNQDIAANSETVRQLNEQQQEAQARLEAAVSAGTDKNGETIETVRQKELGLLQANENSRAYATAVGSNMDANSEILTALGTQYRQAVVEDINARQDVQNKLGQKFWDNPAQWLINQFTIGDTINYADAVHTKLTDIEKSIQGVNLTTQTVAQTNNAIAQTRTSASIEDKLKAMQADTDAQVAATEIKNTGLNIQNIQVMQNMSEQQVHNLAAANSARNQEEHLEIAKKQLAEQTKLRQLQIQERTERLEQKKVDRQELEDLANLVRKGAAAVGYTESSTTLPTNKVIQMLKLKDPMYDEFLKVGMRSETAKVQYLGDDAGSAAKIVVQTNAPLLPAQKEIKSFLTSLWGEAASKDSVRNPLTGANFAYDKGKPDQVSKAVTFLAYSSATQMQSNIKQEDKSNIYSAPPVRAIFSERATAETPLYQKVIEPLLVSGGLTETNPEQIVSIAAKAVKDGTLDYNTAVRNVQTVFMKARDMNNVNRNYAGVGLPQQKGFNTEIPNSIGYRQVFDLTSDKDVGNLISRKIKGYQLGTGRLFD